MSIEPYQSRHRIPSIKDAMATVADRIEGVHEACSAVPKIVQRDFDQLVDSILTNGLRRPIEIDSNGLLVDGRSRLQAFTAAGIPLEEKDIVVTDADPSAIARSNNARRHLTTDQRVMETERLLRKEEELAAQRKAEGGKKGRQSKQCSLGTDSVPSETEPIKRQPRAKDKVAAASGVSRDKLTVARRIRKADPEIAEEVEQGELSLEEAAEKAGVAPKKRVKPIATNPAKPEPTKKSAKSKPAANPSPWRDEFTEVIDTPDGIRTLRCEHATFYIHTTSALVAAVMPDGDGWWWYAGTDDDQGINDHREDAEQSVLDWFSANGGNDA